MVDFLKSNPFVSMEQYKWSLSLPMIRLMSIDNTRVRYLSEKQAKMRGGRVVDFSGMTDSTGFYVPNKGDL